MLYIMAIGDDFDRAITERIRLVRLALNLTREELDIRAGVSMGTTSRIESGARGRQISAKLVAKYASATGQDPGWMLTGQPPNSTWRPLDLAAAKRKLRANPKA